jgi:hypothetical protein
MNIAFFLTVAAGDVVLSSTYLFLFVQPLRETMKLNENQQRSWMTASGVTVIVLSPKANKHASARVAPASLYAPEGDASGPSSPVASSPTADDSSSAATPSAAASSAARSKSLALEVVMRRNALAVAAAICSCVCHFTFSSTAMVIDEPHMRKLTMPVAFIVRHTTQHGTAQHGTDAWLWVSVATLLTRRTFRAHLRLPRLHLPCTCGCAACRTARSWSEHCVWC